MRSLNKAAVTAVAVVAIGLAHSPLAQAANPATAARFTAVVNEMAIKYRMAPITVLTDMSMDAPRRVAETDKFTTRIELSTEYGSMSPAQVQIAMARNIGGYHPGGCDAVRMVAIHEVGHVIDYRRSEKPRKLVATAIGRGQVLSSDLHGAALAADGSVDPGEALATAFAAVECGTATPTERMLYRTLVS